MTISPHALVSAAVSAQVTDSIALAFLIGVVIHFILDALPHVDPGTFTSLNIPITKKDIKLESIHGVYKPWPRWIYYYAVIEFIITFAFIFLVFKNNTNFGIIISGAFGGIFVDIIDNPIFRFHLKWPVFRQIDWLHHKFHYDLPKEKWYWGLPLQLIIMGVSIWSLLKF